MRQTIRHCLLGAILLGLLFTYAAFVQQTLVWGTGFTFLAYTGVAVPYVLHGWRVLRSHTTAALAVNSVVVFLLFASSAAGFACALSQHITVYASAGYLDLAVLQTLIVASAWFLVRILQKLRLHFRKPA